MALNHLTLNEMVEISDAMMQPESAARRRLTSIPSLAALFPILDEAHRGALAVVPTPENPRLKELSAQAAAEDAVHDAAVTSTYGLLTSLAGLVDDGAPYIKLRDELLPDGVAAASQLTYEGQAGYVKRLRANMTDARRAQLASIQVGEGSLLEVVNRWLDAGERIGQLDRERQRLEQAAAGASAGTVSKARFRWIRVVNAVRDVAAIADLSEEDWATVFGHLEETERTADQRAARRRAGSVEQDTAADVGASVPGSGATTTA